MGTRNEHGPTKLCPRGDEHEPHTWDAPGVPKAWCPGIRVVGHVGTRKASAASPATEPEAPKKAELGRVGQAILTVVALAIVTPLVAILWAWAAGVVRSLGGLW